MEAMMQKLLTILTTSQQQAGQAAQMQALLHELPPSPQERPEMQAIRAAWLAGDKLKAIQLYRSVYGVGLKEAQDALEALR